MAKAKRIFICSACGSDFSKWQGRCTVCNEWNTISETEFISEKKKKNTAEVVYLSSIEGESLERILTGINEFDLVCGGGLIPGSVVLIGGEPGIGKSTLAMQIAGHVPSLYVSGEETPIQMRHRAERIDCNPASIKISASTDVDDIIGLLEEEKPQCCIIDSIQTLYSSHIPGLKGSVSQIRESASRLADTARKNNLSLILIGHITKDGSIAGPKLLEHLVDTVLYFEGNFSREFRMLRSFKNRYGSVNEIGLFRMSERGLIEITDKNKVFISPYISSSPGNAISAALEGSRIILFEVQSLVTFTSFPNPRRMSDGFDLNRLILISAVLEKHAGLKLNSFDVFINVSGGFQISEPSADLAVAMSIVSSLKDKPIPEGVALLGEVSLSGEIRPVSHCRRRIQEIKYAGFTTLLMPAMDLDEAKGSGFQENCVGISSIAEAINTLF